MKFKDEDFLKNISDELRRYENSQRDVSDVSSLLTVLETNIDMISEDKQDLKIRLRQEWWDIEQVYAWALFNKKDIIPSSIEENILNIENIIKDADKEFRADL